MISGIGDLRHFNRVWSQRVGVLEQSFLDSGRPLGPSRVLFEIGDSSGRGVRELREKLNLDAGYLSRMLHGLESEGLISIGTDPHDARRRWASLTPDGRIAWDDLEQRANQVAHGILEQLSYAKRELLAKCLRTADLLVRAATAEIVETRIDSPDGQFALSSYFAELARRFPGGFDPGAQNPSSYRPPQGRFFTVRAEGAVVGCGGLQRIDTSVVELKRMWVSPEFRGSGLGGRLLRTLEHKASDNGFEIARLDTNPTLVEAIAMYQSAGYHSIERYNDNPYAGRWFEKALSSGN